MDRSGENVNSGKEWCRGGKEVERGLQRGGEEEGGGEGRLGVDWCRRVGMTMRGGGEGCGRAQKG